MYKFLAGFVIGGGFFGGLAVYVSKLYWQKESKRYAAEYADQCIAEVRAFYEDSNEEKGDTVENKTETFLDENKKEVVIGMDVYEKALAKYTKYSDAAKPEDESYTITVESIHEVLPPNAVLDKEPEMVHKWTDGIFTTPLDDDDECDVYTNPDDLFGIKNTENVPKYQSVTVRNKLTGVIYSIYIEDEPYYV